MPLRGKDHSALVGDDAPYFDSLVDLDQWAIKSTPKLTGVLKFDPSWNPLPSSRGKLLVCHDYKGGYTEVPSALSYTFNFWPFCDTFIYFSHHRVTVPPSGWVTAAHRQGVKVLGTIIFEGSGEEDCLRLIIGHLPKSRTGPAIPSSTTLPVSPHYARLLADLAIQRGFDGYLLNVECPLQGGIEQTRALSAWNALLQAELKAKVGPHAETIWYDSVILSGQLRWQNRLNSLNLPFFLSSTSLFSNYAWPPNYPSLTAQYFLSLDPAIVGNTLPLSTSNTRSLKDIFMGVDVWGRGSHGGGGFGSYKAITHIDPEFLGLSVALFGQAWTWESEQDKPGWSWEKWWDYERKLWIGPEKDGEVVDVPTKDEEPPCPHGPFVPVSNFFARNTPPNPARLPIHLSFSPGVGRSWFVDGVKVLETENGWTDVHKQTSLGDLVWPRPTLAWEGDERKDALPAASSSLSMDDAWNSGSSLMLTVSGPGSTSEDAIFRCVWLPVQSLALTAQHSYDATLVYKPSVHSFIESDVGLSVKLASPSANQTVEITPNAVSHQILPGDWIKLSIKFVLRADDTNDLLASIGLVIGFALMDPFEAFDFSLILGQLNVSSSSPSANVPISHPKVLWVDFDNTDPSAATVDVASGVLNWEVAASLDVLTRLTISSPEDPVPAWTINEASIWFPTFLYFNIYVQTHASGGSAPNPKTALFIGTTGLDGRANRFYVDKEVWPDEIKGAKSVRLFVQGVTDRGVVLPWEHSAYVDVSI